MCPSGGRSPQLLFLTRNSTWHDAIRLLCICRMRPLNFNTKLNFPANFILFLSKFQLNKLFQKPNHEWLSSYRDWIPLMTRLAHLLSCAGSSCTTHCQLDKASLLHILKLVEVFTVPPMYGQSKENKEFYTYDLAFTISSTKVLNL